MPSSLGIVASGAVPFSPLDLSPLAWYDSSDISTITASSNLVSEWRDKSGNARHMSQTSGTNQPSTGASINGLNAITFGAAAWMKTASFTQSQPITILFVFKTASDFSSATMSNYAMLIYGGDSSSSPARLLTQGKRKDQSNKPTMYSGTMRAYASPLSDNTKYLIHVGYNGASSTARLNGTAYTPGNPGTLGISGGLFLSWSTDSQTRINGDVCEIIVTGSTLSAANVSSVETYLNSKWSL